MFCATNKYKQRDDPLWKTKSAVVILETHIHEEENPATLRRGLSLLHYSILPRSLALILIRGAQFV